MNAEKSHLERKTTEIKEFIDSAGEGLRLDRERAMPCVAYETLARRGELVALKLHDIDFHPDGTGMALIRRGKTDAEGQGRSAYLSRETVRWLKVWLTNARISEGALFRRLVGGGKIGGALSPGSIAPIFKRVAQWIGMPERFVKLVSGHSTRVGATQDLAALDIDLAAITQARARRSTRMPLLYAENITARWQTAWHLAYDCLYRSLCFGALSKLKDNAGKARF